MDVCNWYSNYLLKSKIRFAGVGKTIGVNMFILGQTYNVISSRGVYVVTIKAQTQQEVNLLNRIAQIARVELVKPLVKFAYL